MSSFMFIYVKTQLKWHQTTEKYREHLTAMHMGCGNKHLWPVYDTQGYGEGIEINTEATGSHDLCYLSLS